MKYKALMIDVDGSLVVNRLEALPTTKVSQAIAKASKKVHIGVATSRNLEFMEHVFNHLKLSGPSMLLSGAIIIDVESRKILAEHAMKPEEAMAIKRVADALHFCLKINDGIYHGVFTDAYQPKKTYNIYTDPISEELADTFIKKASYLKELVSIKTTSWQPPKIHVAINTITATKQHGILEIAKILNINTKEIIGIGDGENDFALLMACGLKVAMGNASEELKAIADYIAPTVEEDGVADVIEKFIL